MFRILAVLTLIVGSSGFLQAQETQTYVEFGIRSVPPAKTDFPLRKVWKAGDRLIRIDAFDERGAKTTDILENKRGEPHAYLLAGSYPQIQLEVGREIQFFKAQGAVRSDDERRNSRNLTVYRLHLSPYELTLFVDRDTGNPQELEVRSPTRNYSVVYARYVPAEPFDEATFRTDGPRRAYVEFSGRMYIEYARTSTPPSPTDYHVRQLWRDGRESLRMQYPQDLRTGNSTTKIANGLDVYTSMTQPMRVEHTRTNDADGKPHAYILARGGPTSLMGLEIGNEVEFFEKQKAARGPDVTRRRESCAVYTLDAKPYTLTLYVGNRSGVPRELVVKTPAKQYSIKYIRYERNAHVKDDWFLPPEAETEQTPPPTADLPRQPEMHSNPAPRPNNRPSQPQAQPKVRDISWDLNALKKATHDLEPGDTIRFLEPNGSVSFTWRASTEAFAWLEPLNERRYEAAYPLMLKQAEAGDARAQYNLNVLANEGFGSAEEAQKWMAKSRAQGFVPAIWGLGWILEKKASAEAEPAKLIKQARALYREAATHGLVEAEYSLGASEFNSGNEKAGLKWIQLAADHGHEMAKDFVRNYPKTKKGAETQAAQMKASLSLLQNAAEQGDARAETMLGSVYANGVGVPRDLKRAAEWYRKAAEHKQPDAMMALGLLHLDGFGIKKDQAAGIRYLQAAIDMKYGPAAAVLSSRYHIGQGVEKNESWSRAFFNRATELCTPDELTGFGQLILMGDNMPQDKETGLGLILFSANKGYFGAQFQMARYYSSNPGGPRDLREDNAKALAWHLKAAEQGFGLSQLFASEMYYHVGGTRGVKTDIAKAEYWLKKAAAQGIPQAEKNLETLKKESTYTTSAFLRCVPSAASGDRGCRISIALWCSNSYDVPLVEQKKGPSAAELAEMFEGADPMNTNPKLAECLRRVKAAAAQVAALKD